MFLLLKIVYAFKKVCDFKDFFKAHTNRTMNGWINEWMVRDTQYVIAVTQNEIILLFETEWLRLIWLKSKEEKEIERITKLQINMSLSQEIFLKISLLI